MMNYVDAHDERVLERRNYKKMKAEFAKQRAVLDYVAMMTDVELYMEDEIGDEMMADGAMDEAEPADAENTTTENTEEEETIHE